MPGIVGFISRLPPAECERRVEVMVRRLKHEPFYVSGTRAFPELGIYSGWVAMAGSFAAGQVFENERGDVTLLWSGECFSDAPSSGKSPGRELVRRYEEQGDSFINSLNGLFSGLLVDRRQLRAFLFNDRFGLERLYWCETNDGVYFASEAKALLAVVPETRVFDETGVVQFLTFGCTCDWRTLFRGVKVAPGGTLWRIANNECRKDRYFTPTDWENAAPLSGPEFEARFDEVFRRILPRYFESDVPPGISLTGGLDTRMIMACLPKGGQRPVSYTYASETGETVDARLARRVAEACGLEHRLLRFGKDFFRDFAAHFERNVYLTDGCFGLLGTHEVYMNRQGRSISPVRITGNYGSEVLRSMSTFKPLGLAAEVFDAALLLQVEKTGQDANAEVHPVTFAAFNEIPWNLFGNLAAGRSQVTFRTPYLDNEIVGLAYQAPVSVRTSPLSALRFVASHHPALSRIPTDRGLRGTTTGVFGKLRHLFAQAAFKVEYHTNEGLPDWLAPMDGAVRHVNVAALFCGHHKFLHYRRWLRQELADVLRELLADAEKLQQPYWNPDCLRTLAEEHIGGRRNRVRELDAVLTLAMVERSLLRAPTAG